MIDSFGFWRSMSGSFGGASGISFYNSDWGFAAFCVVLSLAMFIYAECWLRPGLEKAVAEDVA